MQVVFAGGIGDFIAVESHLSTEERASITAIGLGCFQARQIREIIELIRPHYPNLQSVFDFVTDFREVHAKRMDRHTALVKQALAHQRNNGKKDYSFFCIFPQIISGQRTFRGFSYLPKVAQTHYYICPFSNKGSNRRNFSKQEWIATNDILRQIGAIGITHHAPPLSLPYIEVLPIKDMATTIEVVAGSKGFIGIDSFPSMIAAQLTLERFIVKCINDKTWERDKMAYFAPHRDFSFLKRRIAMLW